MWKGMILWRLLTLCCVVLLLFPPSGVWAGQLAQTEKVNLTILNRSERSICDVRIAAVIDGEWGENQLQEESIGKNESVSFPLDSGTYDIALVDCDENILLVKRLELSRDYDLIFTLQDLQRSECRTYNDQGVQLYGIGQYDEAIEAFQSASACYHEMDDRANEGATLSNIGFIYSAQGQYTEALEAFEAALVILREVEDRKGEGTTLNNIGGVYRSQGRYAVALEAFEAALAIAREIVDRNGEGSALLNIGGIYYAQGRFADALEQFEAALIILREVEDRRGEGTALNNIGGIYHEQGRYAEALEAFEAALAIARELDDPRGEGIALSNKGGVYDAQGEYTLALEQYQSALMILRKLGDLAAEATTLNDIGTVYNHQGNYSVALRHFEDALAIRQQIGDRTGEGITIHNIGAVYAARGQYAQALAHYEAALRIAQESDDRQGEAISLNNIGGVYYTQGRYEDALEKYEEVLAILSEVGDRTGEGGTLNNIGQVYVQLRRLEEALKQFEAALTIVQEIGDRASEGVTLHNIGAAYATQEKYDEALAQFEAALAIQHEIGDQAGEGQTLNDIGTVYYDQGNHSEALAQFMSALALLQQVGDRASQGITLDNIGSVYVELGQYDDALLNFEEAMDVFDDVRAVAGSEEGRATFIAQHADVYDQAIQLYIEQGQPAEAFQTSERGRARTFLDSLATGYVELFDNSTADLLTRENEAYAVRQAAQDALARAKAITPPDPKLIAELEAQLAAAEKAYEQVLATTKARSNQMADLVPGRNNNVLGLKAVQQRIDEQTTLISYWMLDEMTLAFIVTKDDFSVVELHDATRDNVASAADDLNLWPNLDNPSPRPLRNLYKWLVAPLANHLHTTQVVIIPHQSLHYVPFTALTDGESYFGQQYILSQLPSASVIPFLNQTTMQQDNSVEPTALVFGNPKTDLKNLPSAEDEAVAVADWLATTVYTGTTASELQLHTLISGTQVLHLAAHGGYNTVNPLYSAIYLAADEEKEHDGLLETHEIFGLPLKGSELVVLSACQSNLGELSSGDEVVGLTRAFLFAGAPTVIASLWNVNDAATGTLMTSFYQHWLDEGMSKAAALQAAQADVRANPTWASPFYWAAFTLNGIPEE